MLSKSNSILLRIYGTLCLGRSKLESCSMYYMNSKIVFSNGKWISVRLPVGRDSSWTSSAEWMYANAWVSSIEIGMTENRAEQVAEAIVFKYLYPGVTYDTYLTADIKRCYVKNPEETS